MSKLKLRKNRDGIKIWCRKCRQNNTGCKHYEHQNFRANYIDPITGKHKSKILVVVHEPQAVFLQDTQLAYLTRILNACRLTMEDIALINSATLQDFNYRALQQEFPSNFVLLFGVTPSQLQLPIDFPLYQLQKLERTTFLRAPTLEEIEPSKSDREKLWQSLKKYFDV